MKIGVIGPKDLVKKVVSVSKEFRNLEAVPLEYKIETEAPAIVEANQHLFDGILFTGPIPYYLCASEINQLVVWDYVPYRSTGLVMSLLDVLRVFPQYLEKEFSISVDTLAESEVVEIIDEAQIPVKAVYTREFSPNTNANQDFCDFHEAMFREKKVDVCITCLKSAYKVLKDKGIPVFTITPSVHTIRGTLQRMILEMKSNKMELLRTVVGVIVPNELSNNSAKKRKDLMKIYNVLLEYANRKNLLVFPRMESSFILIETYGQLMLDTDNFKHDPLRTQVLVSTGIDVCVGYGVGINASMAEEYAMNAVELTMKKGGKGCYIFDGTTVIGPLDENGIGSFELETQDNNLTVLSEKTGLTISNLSRTLKALEMLNEHFSATDLASILRISPKTARRILAKLIKADIVRVVGTRSNIGAGRPTKVYALVSGSIETERKRVDV
ncbi:transcriptional regulator [Kosmotoga olearia]|uniref:Transcriptional regulator n=1 Tax=Kosmotoga olearia (strain ATCC BAA-1733 / DSM 21960 / TBF 19.5.1) TaxID=521045 RepID=C5CFI3_KOSOT|nr:transcriptional regulator [Kosmotoga olearia]ACR79401.1 putative transcriptional regulator [Kosmotoga olearia TBF 19.5.1]